MFIVPRGIEHCPKAQDEVEFLIVGLIFISNEAGGKPNLGTPAFPVDRRAIMTRFRRRIAM